MNKFAWDTNHWSVFQRQLKSLEKFLIRVLLKIYVFKVSQYIAERLVCSWPVLPVVIAETTNVYRYSFTAGEAITVKFGTHLSTLCKTGCSLKMSHMRTTRRRSACTDAFVVRCIESITHIVAISEISRAYLASVAEQTGLSLPWLHTAEDRFSHDMAQTESLSETERTFPQPKFVPILGKAYL